MPRRHMSGAESWSHQTLDGSEWLASYATTLQPGRVPLVLNEEKSVWSPDSIRIFWKTDNSLPPTRNQTTFPWLPRP